MNTITVEKGLSAHFKQPSGPSRPGVDWIVRIAGEQAGVVIVRTYFSSNPPQESEKTALADQAATLVKHRLEQGWTPQPGASLEVEAAAITSDATKKQGWKMF